MPGCTTCEPSSDDLLDHCHGLLVEHDDGTATCVEGCGGPRAVHDDVVVGGEVGCPCCAPVPVAAPVLPAQPARAA